MKLRGYKISDEEKKEAEEILSKKIPPYRSRIDNDAYFELYLDIHQLRILCKYFACNISELSQEVTKFREVNK